MPTAFATGPAAVAAGYKESYIDNGALAPAGERYEYRLEKNLVGGAKRRGGLLRVSGLDDGGFSVAVDRALARLNGQRNMRYGFDAAGGGKDSDGSTLTVDVS